MTRRLVALSRAYSAALRRYVTTPSRHQLHEALLLGHQIVALGLETVDLARIHQRALGAVTRIRTSPARITRAETFFRKAATALAEKHSASGGNPQHLIRLKKTLAARTVELAEATAKLRRTIERRLLAEEALHSSTLRCRRLLRRSKRKHSSLRLMARKAFAAHEQHRQALSHDLQDDVAQTLLGINVQLLLLRSKSGIDQQRLIEDIAMTQHVVGESTRTVRMVTRKIRTP